MKKSLESLSGYELKGVNNPKIRAKLEYGKKAHEDKQSSCTYKELSISSSYCANEVRPGSGCRLDCVMVSGSICTVVEIKPDSREAQDEGNKQLTSYEGGLHKLYAADRGALLRAYPELVRCETGLVEGKPGSGKLTVMTRLETYSFCPASAAELGQPLDPIQPDVNGEGD